MQETKQSTSLSVLHPRVTVKGKFLACGDQKFYAKGVTYGTFAPQYDGSQFPDEATVESDFAQMADNGFNCVRTYTVPSKFILDCADRHHLKVMVGIPWEQHLLFLPNKNDILRRVKEAVIACNQHPAILCYTIGNEIPAPIVRWYGKRKIENFLKQLFTAVKSVDPDSLVTYVNYPTTEYLDLDFLDFDCFNVYLETPEKLSAYISRLHNISGDRPLVLAEIGLDSMRNGDYKQAEVLKWQIETIFGKGCAGMFVFAWTDEWWRGGFEIDDWDFGLVDRERHPKPALDAVQLAMKTVPFKDGHRLPFISVVVCSYNGSATIKETLKALLRLDYPEYEVIVVNDGSTDRVPQIIQKYPYKIINTPNRGLSSARNTGLYHARGEIVAYIDDDAYPDPQWLRYLAYAYASSNHAGIGGPNIVPPHDGPIAVCVANAPGGPVHVLSTDEIAEHIPGCNMSFKRDALLKIGGCDPVFRAAGDDVDLCWRIQEAGYTIGYHPSALVWHHRRNSFKAYWKQQKGYGKAEALLEEKWPQKYNGFGHLSWPGRIYGNGWTLPLKTKKEKIYHGSWGSSPFQSIYQPADGFINSIPLMPEWYLGTFFLAICGALGFLWAPLLWAWALFTACIIVVIAQAIYSTRKNSSLPAHYNKFKYRFFIVLLHIIQPIARLCGRIKFGLTPWRSRGAGFKLKYLFSITPQVFQVWSEKWRSMDEWLTMVEKNLVNLKMVARRGGEYDRWDLQTGNKLFASVKALMTIEEHGAEKQFIKLKSKTVWGTFSVVSILLLMSLTYFSMQDKAWIATGFFGLLTGWMIVKSFMERSNAFHSLEVALTKNDVVVKENASVVPIEEEIEPVVVVEKYKWSTRFFKIKEEKDLAKENDVIYKVEN